MSDNGPNFVSAEIKDFFKRNGVRHRTSAPYHLATNGLAEQAVKTFKGGMKRMSTASVQEKITRFLFMYWNTQHATTPAELLLAQKSRSKLDLLRPDTQYKVEQEQAGTHDAHAMFRVLSVGDSVFVKNFTPGATVDWLPRVISGVTGTLSFQITLLGGR